ncbi:MAG: hypothetical protein LBD23_02075 [Oscillospiraceae bacterium]|jgi:hypothetical protein|nr:hypothetical protein [Oscillospiraceae bacterium]
MRLVFYELFKILFTRKGLLLIAVFILAKFLLLSFIQEELDTRIVISRYQYDYYLNILHGKTSLEKERFIIDENEMHINIISMFEEMQDKYVNDELESREWTDFIITYEESLIKQSALSIFLEKAEQFAKLRDIDSQADIEPYFFYEYGWKTVFNYFSYPDFILILPLIIISSAVFNSDLEHGITPILRSAKNGRGVLFITKVAAFVVIAAFLSIISGVLEIIIFNSRFALPETGVPIFSVATFAKTPIRISVLQGQIIIMLMRFVGAVLFGLQCIAFSIMLRNMVLSMFASAMYFLLPILLGSLLPIAGYLFLGLLTGVDILYQYSFIITPLYWLIPVSFYFLLSCISLFLAYRSYCR